MSVQINFTDNELQAIQACAMQNGVTIDEYIKHVLLNYIEEAEEIDDEPFILKGLEEVEQGKYVDGQTFIDGLIGKYDRI